MHWRGVLTMKRSLRLRWVDRIYMRRFFGADHNYFESLEFWHALRIRRMYGVRL